MAKKGLTKGLIEDSAESPIEEYPYVEYNPLCNLLYTLSEELNFFVLGMGLSREEELKIFKKGRHMLDVSNHFSKNNMDKRTLQAEYLCRGDTFKINYMVGARKDNLYEILLIKSSKIEIRTWNCQEKDLRFSDDFSFESGLIVEGDLVKTISDLKNSEFYGTYPRRNVDVKKIKSNQPANFESIYKVIKSYLD